MMKPTIHMNGSDPQRLYDDYINVATAINHALDALVETFPNGRDYYPQGPDAINVAGREHSVRETLLMKVRDEMMDLADHCMEVIEIRDKR